MLVLSTDQFIEASIAFVDRYGNPAAVEGAPVWSVSDEAIMTVAAAADGMSATITTVGGLGTVQLVVRADADMGEGVKEVMGTEDFEVVAGEAKSISLTFGAPVSKDAVPAPAPEPEPAPEPAPVTEEPTA